MTYFLQDTPALQPAETLSACTYDTIFLLDPSALQLQPLPVHSLTLMYMLGCLLGKGITEIHCIYSCIASSKERKCASAQVDFVPVQLKKVYKIVKKWERGGWGEGVKETAGTLEEK